MDCSRLTEPIGDSLPWGMVRDDGNIQIAFGSGDGGFVVLMRVEGIELLGRIRRDGGATVCGQKLSDEQATELAEALQKLLDGASWLFS